VSTTDATRLLEGAAARLERVGWTREELGPAAGPCCLEGTVSHEARQTGVALGVHVAALAFLAQAIAGDPAANGWSAVIVDWNDDVCPDQEAAVEMLRLAAKNSANAEYRRGLFGN
jgi:hypothetical protein